MSLGKSVDPALHLELGNFYSSKEEGKKLDNFRKEAKKDLANVRRNFREEFSAFTAAVEAQREGEKLRQIADDFLEVTKKFYVDPNDDMKWSHQGGLSLASASGGKNPLAEQVFNPATEGFGRGLDDIFRTFKLPKTEEVDLLSRHTDRFFDHLGTTVRGLFPATDYSISKASDPAMHLELNDFFMTAEESRRIQTDNIERLTRGLEDVTPPANQATAATDSLWDSLHKLDGGVGALGGTMDLATLGLDGMQTSMVAGRREALAYAGDLGTLEAQLMSVLAAEARLAGRGGAPRSRAGSPPTLREFLTTPAPPNVEELFQQQKDKGHDISGFRDAHHWWEKHLENVAQLKAAGHAFAQGTAFAPGGLALVGEMGPELVNLPRGSQVIPNPRLGGDVHVHVNVEGSVVAERDLAQRLRQELIRTSRRTVDLGFN